MPEEYRIQYAAHDCPRKPGEDVITWMERILDAAGMPAESREPGQEG